VVVRLTDEITRLQASAARKVADAVLQIGRRMERIRERLAHGEWERWVEDATPWSLRTVVNYLGLARWATEHPADFDRFRQLGPSKLYQLAAAPSPVIAKLKARKRHRVPDRDEPRTLELMTTADLSRVIGDLVGRAPPPDVEPVSIKTIVGGYRRGLDKLQDGTTTLVNRSDEVDRDDAAAMHGELVKMAKQLARAFRL
jgi:hypothetical protein